MHVFTEAQKDWIAALRSGKYRQGVGKLTSLYLGGKMAHCCLGVGAERAIANGAPVVAIDCEHHREYRAAERLGASPHDISVLTFSGVAEYLGLMTPKGLLPFDDRDGQQMSLASCNDGGLTFDQIADLIEHFAEYLFVPTEDR